MKFSQPQTLQQIASILNCDYVGDENFPVLGMNEIHVVESGDIVFVDHPKYYDKALSLKEKMNDQFHDEKIFSHLFLDSKFLILMVVEPNLCIYGTFRHLQIFIRRSDSSP